MNVWLPPVLGGGGGFTARGRVGGQERSVSAVLCCRAGSSSAHTVAAGAAPAEALRS